MSLQETLATIAKSGLPLQGKLDALKFEFDNNLAPPAAVEVLHRATDELIASGAQSRALKAEDVAPEFTLPDPDGNPVSSKALLAKGPLVVTFYRGVWCPFCNFDLSALEEARAEIESRGATRVAISQQTAPKSRNSPRQVPSAWEIGAQLRTGVICAFGSHPTTRRLSSRQQIGSGRWSPPGSTSSPSSAMRRSRPHRATLAG